MCRASILTCARHWTGHLFLFAALWIYVIRYPILKQVYGWCQRRYDSHYHQRNADKYKHEGHPAPLTHAVQAGYGTLDVLLTGGIEMPRAPNGPMSA